MRIIDLENINYAMRNETQFVLHCEEVFHDKVSAAAAAILTGGRDKRIVALTGPSGSGKTTTAMRLRDYLENLGVMLIMGTFLLTYTTSPISLTDGLESLLGFLKKIHAPIHELSMMMSIALRFIPTLIEETDKIMSAQKARGADFESGNIFQRAKALIPILVPLFISAFRRADELATAMECRCYHGGEGRTALHVLRYRTADYLVIAGFVLLVAGIIALKKCGL